MKELIFVCGVNGVGKSSIIPHLATLLSPNEYVIHDFDERGVPERAGSAWRVFEAAHWIEKAEKAVQHTGRITVVCGFIKPTDLGPHIKDVGSKIQCILLDASPEKICERLTKRYTKNGHFDPEQVVIGKTVREFIEGNLYIRDQLRDGFGRLGCPIIDTSPLTPTEVAETILEYIQSFSL